MEGSGDRRCGSTARRRSTGTARYYFGLPVTTRQGRAGGSRARPQYPVVVVWLLPRAGRARRGRSSRRATSAAHGRRHVPHRVHAGGRRAPGQGRARPSTYRYRRVADVDGRGRRDALGCADVPARLRRRRGDRGAWTPGSSARRPPERVTIARTDLDGDSRGRGRAPGGWSRSRSPPDAALPAELPVAAPAREDRYATPGDRLRPRWDTRRFRSKRSCARWPDGAESARGASSTHDAKGEARLALPALPAGAWRLRYETRDEFGADVRDDPRLPGRRASRTPLALPAVLLAERGSVPVGGTARLLAASGLAGQTLLLRDRCATAACRRAPDRWTSAADAVIEIPIAEDGPRRLRRRALARARPPARQRSAQSVFVPWDDKELKVAFATFRDTLRPGAQGDLARHGRGRRTERAGRGDGRPSCSPTCTTAASTPSRRTAAASLLAALSEPHRGRGSAGEPRRESPRAVDLRRRLRACDRTAPGRCTATGSSSSRATASAAPACAGRMMAKSSRAADAARRWRRRCRPAAPPGRACAERSPRRRRTAASSREDAAERRRRARSGAAQRLLRDRVLEAAAPDAARTARPSIEFKVPDSVTSWNVWVHAVTRDLKAGSRPQGDAERQGPDGAAVRAALPARGRRGGAEGRRQQRLGRGACPATVTLDILDTETNASALARVRPDAASRRRARSRPRPGAGADVDVRARDAQARRLLRDPGHGRRRATSRTASCGPCRCCPAACSSRSRASPRCAEGERRTLTLRRHGEAATTRAAIDEQLVVTVDAQLFYSVLNGAAVPRQLPLRVHRADAEPLRLDRHRVVALPRLSGGREDGAGAVEARHAARDRGTRADPNRKMALEETPWLEEARGGKDAAPASINVLDPRIAKAEREAALAKLRKAQTSSRAASPGGRAARPRRT